MSEVAQVTPQSSAAQDPAQVQANLAKLGMAPLMQCFLTVLGIGVGGGFFTVMLASARTGLVAALVGVVSILAFGFFSLRLVLLLMFAGGPCYRKTRAALAEGRIGLSYILRDVEGFNYVVVDEDRRLLTVHGDVFGFDDVRRVAWRIADNKHLLDFTLKSGADPVRTADLGSEASLKQGYARLVNSLGLT